MHFINQSILLKALGWSLISSLWQMALLWLIFLLITGMLKRLSARAKHNLAFLLNGVGSVWFICTLVSNISDGEFISPGFGSVIINNNQLFTIFLRTKKMLAVALPYLTSVYLGTVFFFLIRYIKYYLHLQQMKLTGLHKMDAELRLFTSRVSLQMGIAKKVSVWLSSIVESPMTIGFLKPIILIPVATVNHLTTAQVETILLHELTHIKRNDYLVNLIVSVSGIIFFFNPFARLFIHIIKKEREHCCDDLVLQFQYNPHEYASALLMLEKSRQKQHHLALAAIGKSNQLLLERVRRVTGHQHNVSRYGYSLIGYFVLAIIVCCAVLFKPTRTLTLVSAQPAKSVKYISTRELQEKTFVTVTSPEKIKERKKLKPAEKSIHEEEDEPGNFQNNLVFTSNNESDNGDAQNDATNIFAAIQPETREFTILSPETTPAPVSDNDNSPYVPSSSFSYQIQVTDDTLKPGMTYDEKSADETRQKALEALKEINWKKIQKEISTNGHKVDIDKLQGELQKAFDEVNWDKINSNIGSVLSEADEKRIRENIQLQTRRLQNIRFRNTTQARLLKQQINGQRLRLQQHELNKRIESIRNMQNQMLKVLKIVYI
ncbi:MAG TPA: M56 family metallopeptidase [Puia sp.]|nr:M56 family metallopeptidase [Puia sp.]